MTSFRVVGAVPVLVALRGALVASAGLAKADRIDRALGRARRTVSERAG